jgi:arginine-tRNA-protein transferase
MRYKGTFHPHELLQGRPRPEEEPQWIPAPRPQTSSPC